MQRARREGGIGDVTGVETNRGLRNAVPGMSPIILDNRAPGSATIANAIRPRVESVDLQIGPRASVIAL